MVAETAGEGSGERSERLLDAAAELLVRWGYRRVTIEDIARQAGVGKGTVYLHFRTKEALFLVVMLRVHRRVYTQLVERVAADPSFALPWRATRLVYELIAADDVARPLYLGDPEVLGRLAQESETMFAEVNRQGIEIARRHLGLLREAGLVRTDRTVDEQLECVTAVVAGFYVGGGMSGGGRPESTVAGRAELLEYTLAALLRAPGGDGDADDVPAVAPTLVALFRSLIDLLDAAWERRTR